MPLPKRIERGVALLDEVQPGWADAIDLDTLDLADGCYCVLGQLYGREHPRSRKYRRYREKARELGIDPGSEEYGFLPGRIRSRSLTAWWRYVIRKRQAA